MESTNPKADNADERADGGHVKRYKRKQLEPQPEDSETLAKKARRKERSSVNRLFTARLNDPVKYMRKRLYQIIAHIHVARQNDIGIGMFTYEMFTTALQIAFQICTVGAGLMRAKDDPDKPKDFIEKSQLYAALSGPTTWACFCLLQAKVECSSDKETFEVGDESVKNNYRLEFLHLAFKKFSGSKVYVQDGDYLSASSKGVRGAKLVQLRWDFLPSITFQRTRDAQLFEGFYVKVFNKHIHLDILEDRPPSVFVPENLQIGCNGNKQRTVFGEANAHAKAAALERHAGKCDGEISDFEAPSDVPAATDEERRDCNRFLRKEQRLQAKEKHENKRLIIAKKKSSKAAKIKRVERERNEKAARRKEEKDAAKACKQQREQRENEERQRAREEKRQRKEAAKKEAESQKRTERAVLQALQESDAEEKRQAELAAREAKLAARLEKRARQAEEAQDEKQEAKRRKRFVKKQLRAWDKYTDAAVVHQDNVLKALEKLESTPTDSRTIRRPVYDVETAEVYYEDDVVSRNVDAKGEKIDRPFQQLATIFRFKLQSVYSYDKNTYATPSGKVTVKDWKGRGPLKGFHKPLFV